MADDIYKYEPLWGSWKVEELLGKGSIGNVYKISKTVLGKKYFSAVKFITVTSKNHSTLNLDTAPIKISAKKYLNGAIKSITKEIDLLYKLKGHSNIITYEDHMAQKVTSDTYHIFIRMEYLTSLNQYIHSLDGHQLSEKEIIKIGIDICEALTICHEASILHRDIKEANIFRSRLANFKLGDFSVSRDVFNSCAQTRVGTLYYASPEVFLGKPYNCTVDIYSLGIVLYKLLNKGRLPFMPKYPAFFSSVDIENAHNLRLSGEKFVRPLTGCDDLIKIILKACSFNSEERYQSAKDMKHALMALNVTFANKNVDFDTVTFQPKSTADNHKILENQKQTNIKSLVCSNIKPIRKIGVGLLVILLIIGTVLIFKNTKFNTVNLAVTDNLSKGIHSTNTTMPPESPSSSNNIDANTHSPQNNIVYNKPTPFKEVPLYDNSSNNDSFGENTSKSVILQKKQPTKQKTPKFPSVNSFPSELPNVSEPSIFDTKEYISPTRNSSTITPDLKPTPSKSGLPAIITSPTPSSSTVKEPTKTKNSIEVVLSPE